MRKNLLFALSLSIMSMPSNAKDENWVDPSHCKCTGSSVVSLVYKLGTEEKVLKNYPAALQSGSEGRFRHEMGRCETLLSLINYYGICHSEDVLHLFSLIESE